MYLELKRDHFNQLLGYYSLHEIAAIGGLSPKPKVSKLAIYFSRFAYLHIFDLVELIPPDSLSQFVCWFTDRAKQYQHQRKSRKK